MSAFVRRSLELWLEGGLGFLLADADRGERIDAAGSAVLERQVPRSVEEDVDDHPLRRRDDHLLDELLVLDMAAVAADELHPSSWERDLEDPGVGGVGQVEAHHLAELRAQREIGLAARQEHLAEAPHRRMSRLGAAERRHLVALEQDVVEGQGDFAVDG